MPAFKCKLLVPGRVPPERMRSRSCWIRMRRPILLVCVQPLVPLSAVLWQVSCGWSLVVIIPWTWMSTPITRRPVHVMVTVLWTHAFLCA